MNSCQNLAIYILKELVKAGAEKAECNIKHEKTDELSISDNQIETLSSNILTYIEMKAIKNNKASIVRVYSNDIEEINTTIKMCIQAVENSIVEPGEDISETCSSILLIIPAEKDEILMYNRLKNFIDDVHTQYPKVILSEGSILYSEKEHIYRNTNGANLVEKYGYYNVWSGFNAKDEDDVSSSFGFTYRFKKLDKPIIECFNARELLQSATDSIRPYSATDKFIGTVICTPDVVYEIFQLICSLLISDQPLIQETSRWKENLGKKVASEKLTISSIYSNPEFCLGGAHVSWSGFINRDCTYIEKGVLKNFMVSLYGSRKTGITQIHNEGKGISITPGSKKLNEIITEIPKGILLYGFSGDDPNESYEINGVVQSGFAIENGKKTYALTDTMISCNLLDMLNNIHEISSEVWQDGESSIPYISFNNITIIKK
ncbi:PmbA protein [Anaerosporobacter mobilis DSM 15930]|jgi:PmbA protein|uniref:PmbA protein n=1 Tax=Anaerosporobacter mobilis DSM 15930 TaxID=1120996 RepID=A0A1M7I5K8_9FIRM|nr:metallopeptidase TldD-related protein [Anaerosporobacter mobilis]SHM36061.1 PmbA protein [Anaerosporobacter mobilis DSM 15930]